MATVKLGSSEDLITASISSAGDVQLWDRGKRNFIGLTKEEMEKLVKAWDKICKGIESMLDDPKGRRN